MFKALNEAFIYELKSIGHSWYKLFLISFLPFITFALIISIFKSGVAYELPIAVVDNDKSDLSRMVLSHINANATMRISHTLHSTKEALDLVKSSKVYAVVIIPKHFSRDTLLQKQPHITAMLNTQYILIGKILTSALSSTLMQSSAQVEYVKNLVDLQNPHASINSISPIGIQITPFFNTYKNYFYFLVSALLPAMWQIFIVIATLVSVGILFKNKEEKAVFKDNTHIPFRLIGLLLPYTFAYTFIGILYILYMYSTWAFQGSFAILIFGIFLTVVAYQGIALLFFVTGFDYARSLSLGAVYTAPAFAFLGVTFPVYNMNDFALLWRDMLPISHYIQLQISQANYGADIFFETDKLFGIFIFCLAFIPAFYRFNKRLKKDTP